VYAERANPREQLIDFLDIFLVFDLQYFWFVRPFQNLWIRPCADRQSG